MLEPMRLVMSALSGWETCDVDESAWCSDA